MADRRTRIEEEALRLFAERGIAAVSTRDIAQAVGIGESGLYRHMQSKEELALRVFGQAYRQLAGKIRTALAPHAGDVHGQVTALVETIYAAFDADPVLLRFLVLRQHDTMAALDLGADNPVAMVAEVVDAACARGDIVGLSPEVALAILMGIVLQPMTNSLYGRLSAPVSAHTTAITAAVARALAFTQESRS